MTVTATRETAEDLDRAGGRAMRLHLDGAATGGALSLPTCALGPGSAGPPLHAHPGTDEAFLVLEGVLILRADGRTHRLGAGGSAFVARGTRHNFATTPGDRARFVTVHTPGGLEQVHREVRAAEAAAGRALTAADILPIAQGHDEVLAGPPLLPTSELAVPAAR